MAIELTTTLTPLGYQTLMKNGLTNTIKYYEFFDNTHNYLADATSAPENLIFGVIGSHYQITTSKVSFADYRGIFVAPPTPNEVLAVTSRVQFSFTKTDCNYSFEQPNVSLNIHIARWLNALAASTYSSNMSPGLTLRLLDYVTASIQTLNVATQQYETTNVINNLAITWQPKTQQDINNLGLLSPYFVNALSSTSKVMTDNSNISFGSPHILTFSTNSVNGAPVNGTSVNFSFIPKFGYWVNGNTFLSVKIVEESDSTIYSSIIPAAKVGNSIYYLSSTTPYPTTAGLVGYALSGFINIDGSGETLLTGMINASKLFFNAYGEVSGTKYSIPVNFNLIAGNSQINAITNRFGGELNLNFVYDKSDTTSTNIIELI